MSSSRAGLYLHIPFCVKKCPYCDFYSLPYQDESADKYTKALIRAMERFAASHAGDQGFSTLYIGGGTPSLMGEARLSLLLERASALLGLDSSGEITLEANPGTVTGGLLKSLRKAGFNRLSVGVQSADASELAALGRIHGVSEARDAILAAHHSGFGNISADLMLGIPGQTRESLGSSINFLVGLPLTHISAYLLKIEQGTPFAAREELSIPGDDEASELYLDCVRRLELGGFVQYEVSNFAKEGNACRHNLGYWRCEPYLGLGPAAHSFMDGRRRFFGRDLTAFTASGDFYSIWEDDGPGGSPEERLMLGLRLTEGFDTATLADFGIDPRPLLEKAGILAERGLCSVKDGIISLTPEGFLLSNPATLFLTDVLTDAKNRDGYYPSRW